MINIFKTIIYFDKKKVLEYKSLIEKKKVTETKTFKLSDEKSGKAGLSSLSVGITKKSEIEGEVYESSMLDCEEFEELLKNVSEEHYFDFFEESYDIETILRSSIIRFDASFNIPSEFDMLDMINKFKPLLMRGIKTESDEESEILKSLFGKESTKIPIFIENYETFNNRLGFSKINSKYILCDNIESFEEYENEDVTILAKLTSRTDVKNEPVTVYDVMRDLFSISRSLRRQFMSGEIEGIENIKINENFITLEILAIYQ